VVPRTKPLDCGIFERENDEPVYVFKQREKSYQLPLNRQEKNPRLPWRECLQRIRVCECHVSSLLELRRFYLF
jgi:hypothetical protein